MGQFIVLLRGVNVGGVVLRMEDLRSILEYIGFAKVRTYIQSGNALFESKAGNKRMMEASISEEVKARIGRDVVAIVKSVDELRRIVESHPLASLGDPKNLYVTLLSEDPGAAEVEDLLGTMNDVDRHVVMNRAVYSYYGEGYGSSKRSNNFIEKILKVSATTRNWSTLNELVRLADEDAPSPPRLLS